MSACRLLGITEFRRRELGAGGWGSLNQHWFQWHRKPYFFPPSPCVAGFAGECLDSPQRHYLQTSDSGSLLRRSCDFFLSSQGINPDYYYFRHYIKEEMQPWIFETDNNTYWVRKLLNRRFRGFNDKMTILPEPVLPVGIPGAKIPCAAWQKVFDKCIKKHEDAIGGKCEYLRCKLYECQAKQN